MEYRYTSRYGFVIRVPKDEQYHYVLKWGFVFRESKLCTDNFTGWTNYRFHSSVSIPRFYPGQIIDVDAVTDIVSLGVHGLFLKKWELYR